MLKVLGYLLQFKNEASKELKKVNKDLDTVEKSAKNLAKELQNFNKGISESYEGLNKAMKKFAETHDKQMSKVEKRRKKSQGILSRLDNFMGESLGVSLGKVSTAGAAAAVLATQVTQASSLQRSLIDIQKEAGFSTAAMNHLENSVLQIGVSMSKTKREIVPTMVAIADLGVKGTQDIDLLTRASLEFAQVAGMAPTAIAESLVKLQRKTGTASKDMQQFTAVMMVAAQETAASFEDVVSGVNQFLPLVDKIKQEYRENFVKEMITANAFLANSFPEQADLMQQAMRGLMDVTSEEFRSLSTFLVRYNDNVTQSQLEQMAKTGKATEVLKLFMSAAKKAPMELRRTFETSLNGMEGVTAATIGAIKNLKEEDLNGLLQKTTKSASQAGKVMQEAFKKAQPIADKFWAILDNIGTIIGSISMGILESLGTVLEYTLLPILETITGWITQFKAVGKVIGWVIGILATLTIGVIALNLVLGTTLSVVGVISSIFAVIKFVLLFIAAIATTTVGIFVLIGLVVAGIVYVFYQWGDVIWEYIVGAFKWIGSFIMDTILPGAFSLVSVISSLPEMIGTFLLGMVNGIMSLGSYLKDMVLGALGGIVTFVINSAKSLITNLINYLIGSLNSVLEYASWIGVPTIPLIQTQENVPQLAGGGLVQPTAGGTLVNVAEGGKPEIVADADTLKQFMGTQDIVEAIWGSARYMVDELKKVRSEVQVVQQSSAPTQTPSSSSNNRGFIF